MFQNNLELIESYKELVKILSHQHEFDVKDNELYGVNLMTKDRFLLAQKDQWGVRFKVKKDVRGSILVDHIFRTYYNLIKLTDGPSIDLQTFFADFLKRLGHNSSYSDF